MMFSTWLRYWKRFLEGRSSRKHTLRARPTARRWINPRLEWLEDRLAPAILTVNSVADNTTDTSALNLREAITLINHGGNLASLGQSSMPAGWQSQISGGFGSNDTIQFDPSLSGQTITLSSSLPALTSSVDIVGPGASNLAISGAGQYQVFHASGGDTVSLSGLTIENGAGPGGATTVLGDAGTTLNLNGDRLDASASLTADEAVFSGSNSVAGSYQASSGTMLNGGTTTLSGTVSSLGGNVFVGIPGTPGSSGTLDLSAARLPEAGLTVPYLTVAVNSTLQAPGAITVTESFTSTDGTNSVLGGGTLTLASGSTGTIQSIFTTDHSVVNEGTLSMLYSTMQLAAGQTFTNAPTGTVQMAGSNGNLGGDGGWTFVNQGALVEAPDPSNPSGNGPSDVVSAVFDNQATGTVHVEAGAPPLDFSGGGTVSGKAGTTTVLGDAGTTLGLANLNFDASSSIQAGAVIFGGNNSVAGSYQASDGTWAGVYQASDGTLVQGGTTTLSGTVSSLGANVYVGFDGSTLDLSAARLPAAGLTFSNLTLQINSTLKAPGAITVTGTFDTADGTNSVLGGGTLTLGPGSTGSIQGNFTTDHSVVNEGTLTGSGTIIGDVTNSGKVIPGSPLGVLEVQGNYSQSTAGGLQVLLGGPTPGTQSAELQGDQSIVLGGTLKLQLAAGFTPQVGDTFTILKNAGSSAVTGTFANLPEGATFISSGHLFKISYVGGTGHDVTVTVAQAQPVFSLTAPPTAIRGTSTTQISGSITAGTLIPPGNVMISINGGTPQSAAINPSDGTFSVVVQNSALGTGSYTINYSYVDTQDNNFASASATATMNVTNGVLALFNQSNSKHAGSTIPVQIELVNASGQDLTSGATITAVGMAATTDTTDTVGSIDPSKVGTLQSVQSANNANPGNVFRIQGGSDPFAMYNLQTPTGLAAGTYRLYFSVSNDPLLHWVTFTIS